MANAGQFCSKEAELSKLLNALKAKEPSHTPGHSMPPRTSKAHRATPDAGQMIVAYPGGTASEMPMYPATK